MPNKRGGRLVNSLNILGLSTIGSVAITSAIIFTTPENQQQNPLTAFTSYIDSRLNSETTYAQFADNIVGIDLESDGSLDAMRVRCGVKGLYVFTFPPSLRDQEEYQARFIGI